MFKIFNIVKGPLRFLKNYWLMIAIAIIIILLINIRKIL